MIGHDFPYLDTRDLNLDWLLKNMKQLIQDWATYQTNMNQSFSDLNAAFTALQSWVNSYFDNLDVQQEINNKINSMRDSGELAEILAPTVATTTTAWLAEHITNPSSPPIDTSLSVGGAAADAKVTGDYVRAAENNFNEGTRETERLTTPIDDEYVKSTDGQIYEDSSYKRTDYIEVHRATKIKLEQRVTLNALCFYDEDKTFISGIGSPGDGNWHDIPAGTVYFIFSGGNAAMAAPKYFLYEETFASWIRNQVIWCLRKKINWIGDSIVDGEDFDEEVCAALELVKSTEYGINGSTISLKGDGTNLRNALCERYVLMSNDADLIAVSCGTNDWMYAWAPIGTINDPDDGTSNTTFYGACKALCKGLIDKYPRKVIFFTTPIKRGQAFENGNGGTYTEDGIPTDPFSKNKYGLTLGDYAEIIKEVCALYSIPVLDMYNESLLNPSIASQQDMFDNILTHPLRAAQKIMARRVAGWLTQLGYQID